MLLEATQAHELLANTFYEAKLKHEILNVFPNYTIWFKIILGFMDLQFIYELIHLIINFFQ